MHEYKEIPERLKKIAELRESGKTFGQIGYVFKISDTRARELYNKYLLTKKFNEDLASATYDDIYKLLWTAYEELNRETTYPTRVCNSLYRAGYLKDKDKFLAGEYSDEDFMSIRNFGPKGLTLIHKALEIARRENVG